MCVTRPTHLHSLFITEISSCHNGVPDVILNGIERIQDSADTSLCIVGVRLMWLGFGDDGNAATPGNVQRISQARDATANHHKVEVSAQLF